MTEKILTFYLGGSLLGIDVTRVKEINRNAEFTPVPGSDPCIEGLFNMRGQVVTLFNLARLLGLEEGREVKKLSSVILKIPKDPDQVGFFIDRPGDVIDIDREECEPPPANVGGVEGEYIDSIIKLEEELLIIIEPDRVFKSR